jgi:hypothetical protein
MFLEYDWTYRSHRSGALPWTPHSFETLAAARCASSAYGS